MHFFISNSQENIFLAKKLKNNVGTTFTPGLDTALK